MGLVLLYDLIIAIIAIESVRLGEYNKIVMMCALRRDFMDYLTSAECAEKWSVSQRRVAIYCKEGRIDGAVLMGHMWLIPNNAKKPEDPRKARKYIK